MTEPSRKTEAAPTVRREDFRRNPGEAVKQAIATGRVVITDTAGKRVAVISAPTDRRTVPGD